MNKEANIKRFRSVSIFLKSATVSVIVSMITLAVFAWTMVGHEKKNLFQDLSERGKLLASSLDRVTANAIVAEDWEAVISQCLKIIQAGEGVDYVVVTRKSDGFSLVHTSDSWRLETLTDKAWTHESKANSADIRKHPLDGSATEVMNYAYAFSYSGIDWGWIHVGLTLDDYHKSIEDVVGIIVKLTIPALILGILAAFISARQLTRPVSQLQKFAQKVAQGDLDHRVEVQSNDEVGRLAEAMNQMTEDLKESQQHLEESLTHASQAREKDILLKEIHHRVKNNMQILSSLLRMQARQVDGDSVRTFLKESEARIRSMGLIHEKLYQSKNISEIDFSSYVKTLAGELIRMSDREHPVELSVEIDDVQLAIDTAMPCGLIVNELISNSLKYAFPDQENSSIRVSAAPLGQGRFSLEVADNGIGLGGKAKPEREGSLGTKLVDMLVDQLDGEVSYHNGIGTRVAIEFSESEYTDRM